jgi:GT2 family glycosyltransferase
MSGVAAIIPTLDGARDGNVQRLVADLHAQTLPPDEIELVRGVSPNGRARNVGVKDTRAEILVFLDDDVRLGSAEIVRSFVDHLMADPSLGMVGTSQLLPPDSTAFQRRCARQIPRSASPLVDHLTESDMVTTACCALRRAVLREVGGFHEQLLRGVDPELRFRVRQAGYRIAVVPCAWHHHPMPRTLRALLRMAWRNGAASAYARRHFPEAALYNPDGHVAEFDAQPPLWRRAARNLEGVARDTLLGRWYGLLYRLAYGGGNVLG